MMLRPLGNGESALQVPSICLGTSGIGNVGGKVSPRVAALTVDIAVEKGGGTAYIETSGAYGNGLAEHRTGLALSGHTRRDFILQAKVGYFLRPSPEQEEEGAPIDAFQPGAQPFHLEFAYSGPAIVRQYEDSLQRLGIASVDSLVIHGMDHAVAQARTAANAGKEGAGMDDDHDLLATAEAKLMDQLLDHADGGLEALIQLKKQGKIRAIGAAINAECPIFPDDESKRVEWNRAFVKQLLTRAPVGSIDFLLVANNYTLLDHSAFSCGILDAAAAAGVAVLVAAPFNSGLLTKEDGNFEGTWYQYGAPPPELLERAAAIHAVCTKHTVSLRAAALAFPLGHAAVVSVVVGAKSPTEWQECLQLAADGASIPRAFWAELRANNLIPAEVPLPGDGL